MFGRRRRANQSTELARLALKPEIRIGLKWRQTYHCFRPSQGFAQTEPNRAFLAVAPFEVCYVLLEYEPPLNGIK